MLQRKHYTCGAFSLLLCLTMPLASFGQDADQAKTQESATRTLLQNSLDATASPALQRLIRGKSIMIAEPNELGLQALENNVMIQRSAIWKDMAKEGIEESRSYFDPVFTFSVSYMRSKKYQRKEELDAYKESSVGNTVYFGPNSPIASLVYDKPRPAGYYPETSSAWNALTVNDNPYLFEPEDTWTVAANVNQRLPWGFSLNFNLSTVNAESRWISFDRQSWGDYDRPWKSTAEASLFLPLPFTRNFGEYSWADTEVRRSKLADEQTYWKAQATSNDTLLTVGYAYWDLVYAVKALEATIAQRQSVEQILQKTQSLYDEHLATTYDLAQTKSLLATVKNQEAQFWNTLLATSNTLGEQLNLKEDALILPSGYELALGQNFEGLADKMAAGIEANPSLKEQALMVKSAELSVNQRANYARPDLSLTASYTSTQGSSAFGYESATDSIGDVFANSDKTVASFTAAYGYQLFNKGPEALLTTSKYSRDYEQVRLENVELRLKHDLANSLAQLYSAQSRIGIIEQELRLANTAYEKAFALRADNEATEYELLTKNVDVQNAELRYAQAQVAMKKAEVQILHALGLLPELYSTATAQAANQHLQFVSVSGNNLNQQEGR